MGVSFTAYAIIGVRIPRRQMQVRKTVPGCTHSPPPVAKFCPTCGKPAQKDELDWIVYPYDFDEDEHEESAILPNVIFLTGTEDGDFYACLPEQQPKEHPSSNGGPPDAQVRLDDDAIAVARKTLREALSPFNLWDERSFGLWTVLKC